MDAQKTAIWSVATRSTKLVTTFSLSGIYKDLSLYMIKWQIKYGHPVSEPFLFLHPVFLGRLQSL